MMYRGKKIKIINLMNQKSSWFKFLNENYHFFKSFINEKAFSSSDEHVIQIVQKNKNDEHVIQIVQKKKKWCFKHPL